jgi:protein disulfide-isomerase
MRKSLLSGLILLLLALSRLAGATQAAAADNQIAWFGGSVEEAFDEASSQHKPLFLYWGAVWCPPCNELKRTIFQRPEFVSRTRDFVPVYLDGDSERAQKWGAYFGVVGYPTVLILAPDRTELTRIPGDLDIERYGSVLDLARQKLAPVRDLVAAATTHPETVSDDGWRVLSFYAWDEDEGRTVKPDQLADTLRKIADACPPKLTEPASRLFIASLGANAAQPAQHVVTLPPAQRAEALARLRAIVESPALSRANSSDLIWSAPDLIGGLTPPASLERTGLIKSWQAALDRFAADESLSVEERLGTVYTRLDIFHIDNPKGPVPADLVALARTQVAWADKTATEPHERQSVINAANKVLSAAGLDADAQKLLTAALDTSPAPYYFMEDLADLAQKTGDSKKALYWLKRAWDTSTGPATRFQWGTEYINGLIEMTPDDKVTIQAAAAQMLKELGQHPDALYQRTRIRFDKLSTHLTEWSQKHQGNATLKVLRAQAAPMCTHIPTTEADSRKSCESFLSASV